MENSALSQPSPLVNLRGVTVTSGDGSSQDLGDLKGEVLLIVNVASRCGFTKQYSGLQKLQELYGERGFRVLAFPCNDFGGQEPGDVEEIKEFCAVNYGVTFPIYAKVAIHEAPFSKLQEADPVGAIEWNFEKFLISREGNVVGRFKSGVTPESEQLISSIEAALES